MKLSTIFCLGLSRSSAFPRYWISHGDGVRSSRPCFPAVPALLRGAKVLGLATALLSLGLFAGCGKSQSSSERPSAQPTPAGVAVDAATAGSISGVVRFKGVPPKMKPLDMSQDPGCPSQQPQLSDVVVVNSGKLANVFVYVKEGLPQNLAFGRRETPVVLDQKGCRYDPHVLGIMTGQQLKILNSDTAIHNVHNLPANNPEWNESQSPTDKPIFKTFPHPEMMVSVKCDNHPWMRAYVNVLPHPYFAVSGPDGRFSIKDLPPGEYTLAAVHEKFGEQTMKVKVGAKMDSDARFEFGAQ